MFEKPNSDIVIGVQILAVATLCMVGFTIVWKEIRRVLKVLNSVVVLLETSHNMASPMLDETMSQHVEDHPDEVVEEDEEEEQAEDEEDREEENNTEKVT